MHRKLLKRSLTSVIVPVCTGVVCKHWLVVMVQVGTGWFLMVQVGTGWLLMVQLGTGWFLMVQVGTGWFLTVS